MQAVEVLAMMEDTASLAAGTASTITTETRGSSGRVAIPPVVRGTSEAIPLRDGGIIVAVLTPR